MEYGEKITALRKKRGMTQAELGNELNVTYQAVSKWERGESYPDFETLSKIAKLCGVPITYFEDGIIPENTETAATAVPAPIMLGVCKCCGKAVYEENAGVTSPSLLCTECAEKQQTEPPAPEPAPYYNNYNAPAPAPAMLGVCTKCGKVIYEGNEGETSPALLCKECVKRRAEDKKKAEENKRANAKRQKQLEKAEAHRIRNRGLIAAGIVSAVMLIAAIVMSLINPQNAGEMWLYLGVGAIVAFPFVSQLFWDGIVVAVCGCGFKIIGTPGIIFSFDLDGFIFLIAMKILFALLKIAVLFLSLFFFIALGILISIFSFIPAVIKLTAGYAD